MEGNGNRKKKMDSEFGEEREKVKANQKEC